MAKKYFNSHTEEALSPQFKIGDTFKHYAYKHESERTVTDVLTTYNSAGEITQIQYVTEHLFAGQKIRDCIAGSTIARSI